MQETHIQVSPKSTKAEELNKKNVDDTTTIHNAECNQRLEHKEFSQAKFLFSGQLDYNMPSYLYHV